MVVSIPCAARAAVQWPASIVGTWTGVANLIDVPIAFTSQATGGESCKAITGSIAGDTLEGFYCPSNGLFSFVRFCSGTNSVSQVYTGNLSDGTAAQRGAGEFAAVSACGGAAGYYSFWMQK